MPMPSFNVFDTETTGLPLRKRDMSDPEQPWFLQLGFIIADENFQTLQEYDKIVCPPPGAIFHPRAEAVHGITEERARDEGIPVAHALEEFAHACSLIGDEGIHTAYNLNFDDYIMRAAARRTFPDFADHGKMLYADSTPLCTMEMAKGYLRVPGGAGGYRPVKLEQAYRRITGHKLQGAHDALSDVKGALAILKIMVETLSKDA